MRVVATARASTRFRPEVIDGGRSQSFASAFSRTSVLLPRIRGGHSRTSGQRFSLCTVIVAVEGGIVGNDRKSQNDMDDFGPFW